MQRVNRIPEINTSAKYLIFIEMVVFLNENYSGFATAKHDFLTKNMSCFIQNLKSYVTAGNIVPSTATRYAFTLLKGLCRKNTENAFFLKYRL